MTIAEQMHREGRAEGLLVGRIALLAKQLLLEFGSLDAEDRQRLESASAEQLDTYAERVLTAATLAAVFAE